MDDILSRNLQQLNSTGTFLAMDYKTKLYNSLGSFVSKSYLIRLSILILHFQVNRLLSVYYTSDEEVVNDKELQNFAKDASGFAYGRVTGFPSSFQTIKSLADTLTYLHYLTAVRHHYMNSFSTNWNYALPWAPASFYLPMPTQLGQVNANNFMSYLPNTKAAINQIKMTAPFSIPLKGKELSSRLL
jgi:hypothetical protein